MSEEGTAELYRDCCEAADPATVLEAMDSEDVARVLRMALRLSGPTGTSGLPGAPEVVAAAAMAVAVERFLETHS